MSRKKVHVIEERLAQIEQRLVNANEYLARNVNVEGSSFLHFRDWEGKSGHPLWMRNFMIPKTMKARAHMESLLKSIERKHKDKNLTMRKRRKKYPWQSSI